MRIQYFDATARAVIGPLTKSFPESLFFTSKARGSVNQSTDRRTDRPPPPPKEKLFGSARTTQVPKMYDKKATRAKKRAVCMSELYQGVHGGLKSLKKS